LRYGEGSTFQSNAQLSSLPGDFLMHPKLAVALSAIPPPETQDQALGTAIARGLMTGYHHRWISEDWTVETIEQEFHVPIFNPASKRRSLLYTHAGKFDGIVSQNGDDYLLEHKTCREEISPGSAYWTRLAIDTQISGYLLASWHLGRKLKGVLYDVIRKPEIRPKRLSLNETSRVQTTGCYCNVRLSEDCMLQFGHSGDLRETAEMFQARLVQDTLERPEWYFGRQLVTRLDQELLTYAEELWRTVKDIHAAESLGDHRRNDKACFAYHRPCEYLGLCSGHDCPGPHWRQLPTLHPELEDPSCGSTTLTHSRISSFVTCRRKHFYRYGLGITQWGIPEALAFGSLLHEALAAWWGTAESPSKGEALQARRGVQSRQASSEPHSPSCCAGMGKDEPGCNRAVSPVPHDQERDRLADAD
jgi:PD-(D/E)XK nuclease superfamily